MANIANPSPPRPWIVCGFFTPDYRSWAERLADSLEAVGAPYHLAATDKLPGGWEANTMAKPRAVLAAMDRHPGKVVVFVDVDVEVRGDLAPLADLAGDVALRVRTKRKRDGGVRMHVRSGTMVLKPTEAARRFVAAWVELSHHCHFADDDQTTLSLAMGLAHSTSFTPLDAVWCAAPSDGEVPDAVIVHDMASRDTPKVGRARRWAARLMARA